MVHTPIAMKPIPAVQDISLGLTQLEIAEPAIMPSVEVRTRASAAATKTVSLGFSPSAA